MRTRITAILCGLALLAVACGVPSSGSFNPIDQRAIPDQLIETTTTTTTIPPTTTSTILPSTTSTIQELSTSTTAEPTTSTSPAGLVTMYFLSGAQIYPVQQLLSTPVSVDKALNALTLGPQGPTAIGYRTAIPPGSRFQFTVDPLSVVEVEIPDNFFEQIALPDQLLAVAQIVLTLTELGGVAQVRFLKHGQPIGVFLAGGSVSRPDQVLVRGDYESLLSGPTADSTPSADTVANTSTTTTTTTTAATLPQ